MSPELGTALFSWLATVGSTGFGSPGPSATGVDGVATGATRLRESPTRPSRFDDPGLDATCQAAVLGPAMDTIARSRGSAGKPDPLIGMKRGPAPAGASRGSNRICLPPPLDEVRDSRRARARPWCDAVARTRTLEASGDSIPGRTKEGGRLSRRAPGWCRSARPGEPEAVCHPGRVCDHRDCCCGLRFQWLKQFAAQEFVRNLLLLHGRQPSTLKVGAIRVVVRVVARVFVMEANEYHVVLRLVQPDALVMRRHSQPHRQVHHEQEESRRRQRPPQHRHQTKHLHAELREAASHENPLAPEQPRYHGAERPRNEVHADHADRVVDPETNKDAADAVGDESPDHPHQDRLPRPDDVASRRDGN
mmetsp:Transcript_18794/g.71557  ORF Transcript_18794/g.71557 Transcript_18794/m.71557 type:complete len:363 (+) Transcript_18794:2290-3378(+)